MHVQLLGVITTECAARGRRAKLCGAGATGFKRMDFSAPSEPAEQPERVAVIRGETRRVQFIPRREAVDAGANVDQRDRLRSGAFQ